MTSIWNNAASLESYGGDIGDLEEVGRMTSEVQKEKKYIFYQDKNGNHWYKVEFIIDRGRLSEYEYIFGRKPKRK